MAVTILDSSSDEVGGGATSLGSGVFDASGTDRAIVAGMWSGDSSVQAAPTSVQTSAAANLSAIGNSTLSTFFRRCLFGIVGNASDATETVTFSFSSRDAAVVAAVSLNGVLQTSFATAFTDGQVSGAEASSADPSHTHTGVASGDQLIGFGAFDDIGANVLEVAETGQVELQDVITIGGAYEQTGYLSHRPGSSGSVIGVDTSAAGTTNWSFMSVVVNEAAAGTALPVFMNSYRQHNQSNIG